MSEAYTAMIELLVEHGADVNADDEDGDTPLHLAVIHQAVGTTGLRGVSHNNNNNNNNNKKPQLKSYLQSTCCYKKSN